ncbi:cbb3-type cytochrome oxidase assembly protein CcoS [Pelomonas sp. SE-A7]|uniref:cbb3-type cytochrome oxidase assembly protein CcoS n=1 Tax=Pelomonas sp. SE-A7 TaxID=3054953 RepID=UPI00259CE723|nr:cbb3-type cytochrome oxidase assembly protein CcoS [Pelomonas sp. SE-A7]MDM4765735.1 cbb3-type cytochrome oxidase assembly protein CcoS [Pelomonas sp. SE-A7]
MESLYLLVPLSVLLVLMLVGLFGWALNSGQLEDLEREGERILEPELPSVDGDQGAG